MSLSGRSIALLVATVLALPVAALDPARGDDERPRTGTPTRSLLEIDALGMAAPLQMPKGIIGPDGVEYPGAPQVVRGKDSELFLGLEFDYGCAFGGELFDKGMRRLGRLADTIEESGRRVVFTVAPVKAVVATEKVRQKRLPQGKCTRDGLRHQQEVLDTNDHPLYLPLRRKLRSEKRQVYWKTDPHWTSVGGAVFAKALAHRLRPALRAQQRYADTQATLVGLLTSMLGLDEPETADASVPAGTVTVQTNPGSLEWHGFPYLVYEHSWSSAPAQQTWRGQTLVIGDSFSEFALTNLRPLFRSGRFMWTGHVEEDDMIAAIVDAKTVVIEVYQLAVPASELGQNRFLRKVRAALGQPSGS